MVIVMVTLNYQLKQTTENENGGDKDSVNRRNDPGNEKNAKINLSSSSIFFKEGQGSYSSLSNVQDSLV